MREILRRLTAMLESDARLRVSQENFDALEDAGWRVAEEPFRSGPNSPNLRKRRVATSEDGRIRLAVSINSKIGSTAIAEVDGVIKCYASDNDGNPGSAMNEVIGWAEKLARALDELRAAFPGHAIRGFDDMTMAGFKGKASYGPVKFGVQWISLWDAEPTIGFFVDFGGFVNDELDTVSQLVHAVGEVEISAARAQTPKGKVPMSIVDPLVKLGWTASREDIIFGDRGARRLDWPCATSPDGRIKIWPNDGKVLITVVTFDGLVTTTDLRLPASQAQSTLATMDKIIAALPGYAVRRTKHKLQLVSGESLVSIYPQVNSGEVTMTVSDGGNRVYLGVKASSDLRGFRDALSRPITMVMTTRTSLPVEAFVSRQFRR